MVDLLIDIFEHITDEELGNITRELLTNIVTKRRIEKERLEELEVKQLNCEHINTHEEVSEYLNGAPDRYWTYCSDCKKLLST